VAYLRILSNSAAAGVVVAVYLTLLVLQLNPGVGPTAGAISSVFAVTVLSYGAVVAASTCAVYLLRQVAGFGLTNPAWVSLRLLAWTSAVASGAVAALSWQHGRALQTTLDPSAPPTLTRTALILGAASALLVGTALTRTFVRRAPAVVAATYVVFSIGSIGVALATAGTPALAPPGAPPASASADTGGPRVLLVLVDGASLDFVSPAVAAGRLPNLGRLLETGASMHLATTRPTQPQTAWASAFTGKWPSHHAIRGAARYRPFGDGPALEVLPDYLFAQALLGLGLLVEEPYEFPDRGAPPLWQVLSEQGVTVGIIGLPLTHPARPVRGFVVSDRQATLDAASSDAPRAYYPPEVYAEARHTVGEAGVPGRAAGGRAALPALTEGAAADVASDQLRDDLAARLARAQEVRVLAVRYAGLDTVAHHYLRFAIPDAFGDVTEEERQASGRVLHDYYAYLDTIVGDTMGRLREGDLLLVASAFGMEPLTPGKRLVERLVGNPRLSGTHERAPDGFLLAYGTPTARGRLRRGAVVDLTPTILYFLGLPVGRDMDGFVRTDLFTAAFNDERAITFIPTHDR
jgi:hypothetical protein